MDRAAVPDLCPSHYAGGVLCLLPNLTQTALAAPAPTSGCVGNSLPVPQRLDLLRLHCALLT